MNVKIEISSWDKDQRSAYIYTIIVVALYRYGESETSNALSFLFFSLSAKHYILIISSVQLQLII